jgi:hypothetical protein
MTFCLLVDKTTDSMQFILMELLVMTFFSLQNGTNGGQTGVSPISIDAEQFQ